MGSKTITLAEGKRLDDLQPSPGAPGELPHGTTFEIELTLSKWMPAAPVFDMLGAEIFSQQFLKETGGELIDVEGVGGNRVLLHCRSNAVPLLGLIIGLAILLGAVAFLITSVKITTEAIDELSSGIQYLAVAVLVGVIIVAVSRFRQWTS